MRRKLAASKKKSYQPGPNSKKTKLSSSENEASDHQDANNIGNTLLVETDAKQNCESIDCGSAEKFHTSKVKKETKNGFNMENCACPDRNEKYSTQVELNPDNATTSVSLASLENLYSTCLPESVRNATSGTSDLAGICNLQCPERNSENSSNMFRIPGQVECDNHKLRKVPSSVDEAAPSINHTANEAQDTNAVPQESHYSVNDKENFKENNVEALLSNALGADALPGVSKNLKAEDNCNLGGTSYAENVVKEASGSECGNQKSENPVSETCAKETLSSSIYPFHFNFLGMSSAERRAFHVIGNLPEKTLIDIILQSKEVFHLHFDCSTVNRQSSSIYPFHFNFLGMSSAERRAFHVIGNLPEKTLIDIILQSKEVFHLHFDCSTVNRPSSSIYPFHFNFLGMSSAERRAFHVIGNLPEKTYGDDCAKSKLENSKRNDSSVPLYGLLDCYKESNNSSLLCPSNSVTCTKSENVQGHLNSTFMNDVSPLSVKDNWGKYSIGVSTEHHMFQSFSEGNVKISSKDPCLKLPLPANTTMPSSSLENLSERSQNVDNVVLKSSDTTAQTASRTPHITSLWGDSKQIKKEPAHDLTVSDAKSPSSDGSVRSSVCTDMNDVLSTETSKSILKAKQSVLPLIPPTCEAPVMHGFLSGCASSDSQGSEVSSVSSHVQTDLAQHSFAPSVSSDWTQTTVTNYSLPLGSSKDIVEQVALSDLSPKLNLASDSPRLPFLSTNAQELEVPHVKNQCCHDASKTSKNFLNLILAWNVDWLYQQAYSSGTPVTNIIKKAKLVYDTYNDYYATYSSFLIHEAWELIYEAWKREKFFCNYFCHGKLYQKWENTGTEVHFETVISSADFSNSKFPREGYMVSIKFGLAGNKVVKAFGYVFHHLCQTFERQTTTSFPCCEFHNKQSTEDGFFLSLKIRTFFKSDDVDFTSLARLQVLYFLKPLVQQHDALQQLQHTPLCEAVLSPGSVACSVISLPKGHSSRRNNEDAIGAMVCLIVQPSPRVIVVEAVPGTDKINTLVKVISYAKEKDMPMGLLFCSRSGEVLDDICCRISNFESKEVVRCVRVGRSSKIHPQVRAISIQSLTESWVKKVTEREMSTLKEEICNLKKRRDRIKKSMTAFVGWSVIVGKLEKRLVACEMNINQKTSEMEKLKAKIATSVNKQKAKWAFFNNADVILCTLADCHELELVDESGKKAYVPLKYCIIEDANQCTELETLLPLLLGVTKIMLVGDPNVPPRVLSKLSQNCDFDLSYFKRIGSQFFLKKKKKKLR